jgi:hypothetical protein
MISAFDTVVSVVVTSDTILDSSSRGITEVAKLSIPTVFETKDSFVVPSEFKNFTVVEELDYKSLSTPYILLLHNNFDFDKEDANLRRMIEVAEKQNADIVTGSIQNEKGQWDTRHRLIIQDRHIFLL